MRYISRLFQPVITMPKNAKIKNTEITCRSQKLLLECGLVRPTSSGLFTLLPLAQRAIDKLEALIRTHIDNVGGQRVLLPTLASESLWEKSGRLGTGAELMTMTDRHDKKYLLAPTHEESIADLLADVGPISYKQLPLLLYQITNKYRDEFRPKHGILRAREFRMMDAYGAHVTTECAEQMYDVVCDVYERIFEQLGLRVCRVKAPSGEMGGTISHEWQLVAEAGEDAIDVCRSCSHSRLGSEGGKRQCECGGDMKTVNSVEVGHTFVLGTKYSKPLEALYTPAQGATRPIVMTCYGIGITRLLAASIESLSSDKCLRWPEAIAPYNTIIIGPKEGSKEWLALGPRHVEDLASRLGDDVIIDDRHHLTIGKRLLMADKMGYPRIIVCGKSTVESPPRYEIYHTKPNGEYTTHIIEEQDLKNNLNDGEEKLMKNKL